MGITPDQFLEMQRRTLKARGVVEQVALVGTGVDLEIPLHNEIIKHCNAQFPRWKFIHANPSQPSSIQVGCSDFPIIYLPGGKFVIVEVKAKNGKLKPEQLAWNLELEMLGHTPKVVRSMDEYREAVRTVLG